MGAWLGSEKRNWAPHGGSSAKLQPLGYVGDNALRERGPEEEVGTQSGVRVKGRGGRLVLELPG